MGPIHAVTEKALRLHKGSVYNLYNKEKTAQVSVILQTKPGLTCVVAIGTCVWPLALAEAPHGALVVHTFFIDGIYVVLWGTQGPKGLLTVLTTVGATRAWRKERQRKERC